MSKQSFVPLPPYPGYSTEQMVTLSHEFVTRLQSRRTVRDFAEKSVPKEVVMNAIKAAATAPNGANMQPWHFVVVQDQSIKRTIREAAEKEEREFYEKRASNEWLEALAPLGTDEHKPFLEHAPYLIVIFQQRYGINALGKKVKHYYTPESVGIATGMLITALHWAGLATLTHTPSPMGFLNDILKRPKNEKPFLILVVGHPDSRAMVPDIDKKPLEEIVSVV